MTFPSTRFTSLVGCSVPLQQAAMGGVSTSALSAAVARAGGLGMLAATGLSGEAVVALVGETLAAAGSRARVGVNFLMPFLDIASVAAASEVAAVVECFYGDPSADVVGRIHPTSLAAWQVGSRDEAVAAVDAGCDLVVVQGVEAGGHVRGTVPLLALLASVREAVGTDVVLVGAGGIATGASAARAFEAGADAVRLGTRLVATPEADAHPSYLDALVDAAADDTVLTEAFSLGWPSAPHRVLRSSVDASNADPSARSPFPPTRSFTGDVASAALYAGTSVGDIGSVEAAEALVTRLMAETAQALSR